MECKVEIANYSAAETIAAPKEEDDNIFADIKLENTVQEIAYLDVTDADIIDFSNSNHEVDTSSTDSDGLLLYLICMFIL